MCNGIDKRLVYHFLKSKRFSEGVDDMENIIIAVGLRKLEVIDVSVTKTLVALLGSSNEDVKREASISLMKLNNST